MIRALRHKFYAPCILILSILLAAIISSPSRAQENSSGLLTQITPAFEGAFKYGEWLPVWVEVENQGADREIEIQIEVKNNVGTTTYAAPLSLPTNSRKRTPIYVRPNAFTRELSVKLIESSSTNVQSQTLLEEKVSVTAVVNRSLMVGIFSRERGPLAMLQNISQPAMMADVQIVDITALDLPPKSQALRSFDIIVINDVDTSMLTAEQGSAIEEWVRAGGQLILGGGGSAARTIAGLPTSLQPQFIGVTSEVDQVDGLVAFATGKRINESTAEEDNTPGIKQEDAPEIKKENTKDAIKVVGPFVVHWANFADDVVLAGDAESPLVVESMLGQGSVKYVALSLTDSPFDAWSGNTQFLQAMLGPITSSPEWLPPDTSLQQMRASQMNQALNRLPALSLPSIRWLGILLGIYILVVGPINYLLLRYFRRLHFAWITIPLLTLAFAAGAFGLGYALRGNDLILNHIAVVEPQPDGSSKVDNYIGLFSPTERTYNIDIDNDSLIMPMPQNDMFMMGMGRPPGSGFEASGDMTIINGRPAQIRDFGVNQWAMQSFQTEEKWGDFGTISADISLNDSQVVGEIHNGTNQLILDAVLLIGQDFERLGAIGAGETQPVSFDIGRSIRNEFGGSIWWNIYGATPQEDGRVSPPDPKDDVKRQIAESTFHSNYSGPSGGTFAGQILLVGWLDQTPLTVRVDERIPTRQTTALVYTEVAFTWPETGTLTIPSNLMSTHLIEHPSNGGSCSSANHLHMMGGDAVLQYTLPQNQTFEAVKAVEVEIRQDFENQPKQLIEIELYNWQDKSWMAIDAAETNSSTEDRYELKQADPASDTGINTLVNSQGEIRMRITADPSAPFDDCRFFDLSITGDL